jgi:hypothetical protein
MILTMDSARLGVVGAFCPLRMIVTQAGVIVRKGKVYDRVFILRRLRHPSTSLRAGSKTEVVPFYKTSFGKSFSAVCKARTLRYFPRSQNRDLGTQSWYKSGGQRPSVYNESERYCSPTHSHKCANGWGTVLLFEGRINSYLRVAER